MRRLPPWHVWLPQKQKQQGEDSDKGNGEEE